MATGYNAESKEQLFEEYASYKNGADELTENWNELSDEEKWNEIEADEFTIEQSKDKFEERE
jgi:hypothetical protein